MSIFQKLIILLIISLIAGWFYWFQWRPSQIKKDCTREAYDASHDILVDRINDAFDKAQQGLDNGTIVNNSGKSPQELKDETIQKLEGNFDQEWFKNSYTACLHKNGL